MWGGSAGSYHIVVLLLSFLRTSILSSVAAVLIYIPTTGVQKFAFLYILTTIHYFYIFDDSYSKQ